jgi:hypothetical protein
VRLAVLDELSSVCVHRAGSRFISATGVLLRKAGFYLLWQVCRQDCVRISQLLRQGPLKVTGQARRQDESSLEHFAKHASPPPVFCPLTPLCASASKVSSESSTTQRPSFI